jgi:cell division control protein 7
VDFGPPRFCLNVLIRRVVSPNIQLIITAIDIWSAGVILLTLLTKRYPFFQSSDDQDAIVEIACIFGNREMESAATKYGRVWKCDVPTVHDQRMPFDELVAVFNPEHAGQYTADVYDLLEKCLKLDVTERISAKEALEHPFIKMYI